jgi:excinuclease ABC subunit C
MTSEEFSALSAGIPHQPGIYKYFDAEDTLLYVGKAKDLRKRVSSYFSKTHSSYKTYELVQRIHHIEFTIVNNEQDAFLLENSLIKTFKPRFNIDLKDDKTYPYIVIKKEAFPRIFFTRRKIQDGSQYLGPYTSVGKVRELLDFIKLQIPLRTCKLNLAPEQIAKNKYKVCLEYHLGNCKGPCANLQSAEDYELGLQQVKDILKGNLNQVIGAFKKDMQDAVSLLEFEKAEFIKKKIEHLQQYKSKSTIVVFSILEEHDTAFVNYLAVNNGTIVLTKTVELTKKLEESAAEVLSFAIIDLRQQFASEAQEIIVPFTLEGMPPDLKITIPKAGDKKQLLELSEKNVDYFAHELKQKKLLLLEEKTDEEVLDVLVQIQQYLHLKELPLHIECFDNSNFQGSYPVSAMVCFKNGMPSKNDYRRFNVKTVVGPDDFATMREVVYRRYKRLTEEGKQLPNLVIIDGGKGQLGAAMDSIRLLQLEGKLTLVGLAKNEEEIFFTGDTESIKLPWNSESLKLIRRIRDEVHRFGITFHRNQRSRGSFKISLDGIPGIGKTTADQLLKSFKSIKNIKEADLAALTAVIGPSRAVLIKKHFEKLEGA